MDGWKGRGKKRNIEFNIAFNLTVSQSSDRAFRKEHYTLFRYIGQCIITGVRFVTSVGSLYQIKVINTI